MITIIITIKLSLSLLTHAAGRYTIIMELLLLIDPMFFPMPN